MHVHDKATRIKGSTTLMRERFNLIDTEIVIQEYHVSKGLSTGKLYITQNYVGYIPSVLGDEVLLSFFKMKSVGFERGILGVGSSINIVMEDSNNVFVFRSMFGTRLEEVFNLIQYLKDYPPMYVDEEEDHSSVSNVSAGSNSFNASPTIAPMGSKQDRAALFGNEGGGAASQVDTRTTKEALRTLHEAKNIGTSSLTTLHRQGEQLDRIEDNLDRVDHNLATSDKLVKGMTKFGGLFASESDGRVKDLPKKDRPNRKIDVQVEAKPVDLEILHKLQNCSLEKAQLRFTPDRFMIMKDKKPVAQTIKEYNQITAIVIRTRPQHIDIRLKENRIRIVTSYPQRVVAEFVARMDPSVHIAFETDARVFSYGASVREVDQSNRGDHSSFKRVSTNNKQNSNVGSNNNNTSNSNNNTKNFASDNNSSRQSNNYVSNTSQQSGKVADSSRMFRDENVRMAIQEQNQDLDEMSKILDDLGAIAGAIGTELDRQTDHLDYLNDRVDRSNAKQVDLNRKLNKML
eukprot:TRINITY_DN3783_c0_g1_i1.p1 TRINITY_DN3783_c0_g1~~TRINITY_DN3783_c0_g1_i1.p1  ORF type:complete len:516 (-),score=170.75 TRINITY_DN3783_c0_g1_i1:149-1696(-)